MLYGQTMGGWGILSFGGASVMVPGMAVALLQADKACVEGFFAKGKNLLGGRVMKKMVMTSAFS